jgi:hypothetical protein
LREGGTEHASSTALERASLTVTLVAPVLGFARVSCKLEIADRTEAARCAYEHGLIDNAPAEH